MKIMLNILLACSLFLMSIIGNSQSIDAVVTNPTSTRAKFTYTFTPGIPTNVFQYWIVQPPNAYLVDAYGNPNVNVFNSKLYVKWKNVEASAYPDSCNLQVEYTDYLYVNIQLSV